MVAFMYFPMVLVDYFDIFTKKQAKVKIKIKNSTRTAAQRTQRRSRSKAERKARKEGAKTLIVNKKTPSLRGALVTWQSHWVS